VTIFVWRRQAGRLWGPVVVLRGVAVIGSDSSATLWTVPGGTPRAPVTRSMCSSHRLCTARTGEHGRCREYAAGSSMGRIAAIEPSER
jgi:hypothetical protein